MRWYYRRTAEQAGVSVPFRGSCSEIVDNLHFIIEIDRKVSVPFRGSCSEISSVRLHSPRRMGFPSPFGVRVLKSVEGSDERRALDKRVSVPFRGSCSEINTTIVYTTTIIKSFRPLSGFVF